MLSLLGGGLVEDHHAIMFAEGGTNWSHFAVDQCCVSEFARSRVCAGRVCASRPKHLLRAESFLAFWYYDTVLLVI